MALPKTGLALLLLLASVTANAQAEPESTTLPLDRFRTPIDDKGLGVTEGGAIPGHLAFQTGLVLNYALNPLVVRDDNGVVVAAIVAHKVSGDLLFTIGLFEYLSVGLDLPLTLVQVGGDVPDGLKEVLGVANGLAGIGVGDLRLVPKVRLLREDVHFVSLALIPTITLPTAGGIRFNPAGPEFQYGGDYLGEGPGAFAFIPEVAVSTNIKGLRPAANLAYRLRQPSSFLGTLQIHPELVYRVGLGYELGEYIPDLQGLLVYGELFGATADRNPFGLFDPDADADEVRIQNPIEILFGGRWKAGYGVTVEGGFGSGLRAGYGSPDLRVFAGVRYGVEDLDKDDDGVEDKVDACIEEPEDKDGHDDVDGCPDRDNDGDGLPDGSDKCPDVAEDADAFQDEDGCADDDNDADTTKDVDDECRDIAGPAKWKGCPPPDKDGDGFHDDDDVCPEVPGIAEPSSKKKGCPEDDKDKDGVIDVDDACPEVPGTRPTRGCPDKDEDTIVDSLDRCPDVMGNLAMQGCADGDADGLADPDDKCPTEPETINGIDDADGCPDKGKVLVIVTKTKVELKESVFFDSGKATIQARSSSLLDQIAQVMKAHPEVKKIRIEGHTDSAGADDKNLELSKKRARAVLDALLTRGIEPARLDSEGFGETKPIADNKTKDGKAQNRRVELAIVE
ncbi:MAG: OmpA family protein [Deltaproteobacteria bacterium]|nr:OmpA family protein [Deltaproteobacteria bacterium]